MTRERFKTIEFVDQQLFAQLFEAWGFAHAACYRLQGKTLIFTIGSPFSDDREWPATVDLVTLHYTDSKQDLLPFGWYKPKRITEFGRNTIFYAPEQEDQMVKLLFALVPATSRRREQGQLDGTLEAIAKRLAAQINQSETRQFISEALLAEHASKLSRDTKVLIDHELRTPLSTIAGLAHLLADHSDRQVHEGGAVIIEQVSRLLNSIEKLSLTIGAAYHDDLERERFARFDLLELVQETAEAVVLHAASERPDAPAPVVHVVDGRNGADFYFVGHRTRLARALWEVMHNAVIYSLNTTVQVTLYLSGSNVIIDVKESGVGIPKGAEDLIFLQFYKGQSDIKVRRGHRGLGLGLYLAKHIIEQHTGQLLLVRQGEKGALFRFILPHSVTLHEAS